MCALSKLSSASSSILIYKRSQFKQKQRDLFNFNQITIFLGKLLIFSTKFKLNHTQKKDHVSERGLKMVAMTGLEPVTPAL